MSRPLPPLLLLAALAATVAAAQPITVEVVELDPDLHVEPLTDGVWLYEAWAEMPELGRVPSNGLVVAGDGEALLVDTPWTPRLTAVILDWVEQELGLVAVAAVATHSHADRAGGLVEVHRRGIASWASRATAEIAEREGDERPTSTFEGSAALLVGGRLVELHYPGPGHTRDNTVVWVPDAELLHGGCLLRSAAANGLGYTDEADLAAWPRTVERLLDRYPSASRVIPGHGAAGGREILHHTLRLVRDATPPR